MKYDIITPPRADDWIKIPKGNSIEASIIHTNFWRIGWAIKHMGYWERLRV